MCSSQKNWIYRVAGSGDLLQSHYYINWIYALNCSTLDITASAKSYNLSDVISVTSLLQYKSSNDLVTMSWCYTEDDNVVDIDSIDSS